MLKLSLQVKKFTQCARFLTDVFDLSMFFRIRPYTLRDRYLKGMMVCVLVFPVAQYSDRSWALVVSDGAEHVLSNGTLVTKDADGIPGYGVLVRNPGSSIVANNLQVTTSGQNAVGVKLENEGAIHLVGGSIQTTSSSGNSSSAAYGVWVTGKGLAELANMAVSTSGAFAHGLYAFKEPALGQNGIVARNVMVNTSGATAYGASAVSNASMELSGVSITTSGAGARVVNAQRGNVRISDSTLLSTGDNAPGLMVLADASGIGSHVVVTDTSVETRGSLSNAVRVEGKSTLSYSGGSIRTLAPGGTGSLSAYGVWVTGGSLANLSHLTVNTSGSYAYGLFSTYKPTVDSVSIRALEVGVETTGANAHGVYAHSNSAIEFAGGQINTSGQSATGARAEAGGTLTLSDSSITTTGNASAGLLATANASGQQANAVADNVVISTSGTSAAGVAAFQQGSSVTLSHSTVSTRGDRSNGLSAESTAVLAVDHTAVQTQGTLGYGVHASSNAAVNLQGSTIATSGAQASALHAEGNSRIGVIDSTISTQGASAHGIELLSASQVNLSNSSIVATGTGASGILGKFSAPGTNNEVALTDSLIRSSGTGVSITGGASEISLVRSRITADNDIALDVKGKLNLTVTDHSYLSGAALKDSGDSVSNLTLSDSSLWNMSGSSRLTRLVNDTSSIVFSSPDNPVNASDYKTMIVNNYVGNDGHITLNTRLGQSDSLSDTLVIDGGHASGKTYLLINNVGGLGALTTGDGINIIDTVNGGTTDKEAFVLGSRVAAGAYEYSLYRGGQANADSWFLRSATETYRPEVPVYMVAPALISRFGLVMLGTCDERMSSYVGVQAKCGEARPNTLWGRVFGESGDVEYGAGSRLDRFKDFQNHGPSYDYDIGGFQVGMDIWGQKLQSGSSNTAGFYVGAGTVQATIDQIQGARAGKTSMNGYSLGLYGTHKKTSGFYADVVLQGTHYSHIRAASQGEQAQTLKTDGWDFSGSLEVGYPLALDDGWMITPQAQAVYQRLILDDAHDDFGQVRFSNEAVIHGRLGGRLSKDWITENRRQITTWGRANTWHSFGTQAKTTFTDLEGFHPVALGTDLGGTWAQLGLGASGYVSDKVSVSVSGDYNFALGQGDGSSLRGTVTLNIAF